MKKRLVKMILIILSIVLLGMVTIGCTSSIVGKWQDSEQQTTLEFTKDRQVIFMSEGFTFTGTYELIGSEVIKVKLEGVGAFLTAFDGGNWRYKISGNTMTIQVGDTTYTLTRK